AGRLGGVAAIPGVDGDPVPDKGFGAIAQIAQADGADDLVAGEGDGPLEGATLGDAGGVAPDPGEGAAFGEGVREAEGVVGDAGDGEQRLDGRGVGLGDGTEDEAVGAEDGDGGH